MDRRRVIESAFAIVGAVLLSPPGIIVALIAYTSWEKGQRRVMTREECFGPDGTTFRTYQFAVSPVSHFHTLMQKTEIVKLPEILSVIKGHMSWFGHAPVPINNSAGIDRAEYDRLYPPTGPGNRPTKPGLYNGSPASFFVKHTPY